ncbi:MAG: amidohydrolase family protein [Candidatus Dormibacteraeota bacterium]|uniref:Amidohydrolase family protein n=1 Tax=Candidatus Aeolococcus gillhamiae TaxID=3127015 RepID=A0A934JQL5_9BACT|nr:amidohydrolase family protein [Candidatus Dormibacteraeota bacterium]
MSVDLTIKNGIVVSAAGAFRGGLSAENGVIVAMGADSILPAAETTVDAKGCVIFPGAIDPHVHLGVGGTADEAKLTADFRTEPRAAATGGITCFVTNHENATGPSYVTTTQTGTYDGRELTLLDKMKAIGEARSVIDFRFTALPQSRAHLDEIPRLVKEGVSSFKFYPSYDDEEAADFGIERLDWGFIYEGFERLAAARTPELAPIGMVHCEEPYICAMLKRRLRAEGRPAGLAAWAESRPAIAEAMQIFDVGMIAKDTGCRAYIVHTSSRDGTDTIAYLKKLGVDIVGETCTHYLVLTDQAQLERWAKVNPPIRGTEHQNRLWEALVDGTHEVVGSDDCGTYTRQEKLGKDFWDAIPGFSDMAASLTLLVSEGVNKNRLSWQQLARVIAENPARYYGMYPRKGTLQVGSDADVVIIDPTEDWTIAAEAFNYTTDFSIYEGMRVRGRPVTTVVRGLVVADHGEVVAPEGHGTYVASGVIKALEGALA